MSDQITYTYQINAHSLNAYANVGGVKEVVKTVELTVNANHVDGRTASKTRHVTVFDPDVDTIDPENFVSLNDLRSDPEAVKVVVGWAVDKLKSIESPDPEAEFAYQTIDTYTLLIRELNHRLLDPVSAGVSNDPDQRRNETQVSIDGKTPRNGGALMPHHRDDPVSIG